MNIYHSHHSLVIELMKLAQPAVKFRNQHFRQKWTKSGNNLVCQNKASF